MPATAQKLDAAGRAQLALFPRAELRASTVPRLEELRYGDGEWKGRVTVPVHLVSEANRRMLSKGAVFAHAKRTREQKQTVRFALDAHFGPRPPRPPLHVSLTRIAPCPLDDDNLATSCKYVRDSIAAWLGIDDRKRDLVRYHYDQRRGGKGVYAVEILIERRAIEPDARRA